MVYGLWFMVYGLWKNGIMGNFQELRVWQKAKDLAVEIYQLTNKTEAFSTDYRLKSQMCAAAVSIASNIAEGDELSSNKQSNRHFYIAKGSCAELITQIIIAKEIEYIAEEKAEELVNSCKHLSSMLFKLIKARE